MLKYNYKLIYLFIIYKIKNKYYIIFFSIIWSQSIILKENYYADLNILTILVKMVSEPEKWPVFEAYLEDLKILKDSFSSSQIIHISRTQNKKADSLARSARRQSSFVVHMDAELPTWFSESIWISVLLYKKTKFNDIIIFKTFM